MLVSRPREREGAWRSSACESVTARNAVWQRCRAGGGRPAVGGGTLVDGSAAAGLGKGFGGGQGELADVKTALNRSEDGEDEQQQARR